MSGRVTHGTKPGPQPYLSKEEEETVFARFLVDTAQASQISNTCAIVPSLSY